MPQLFAPFRRTLRCTASTHGDTFMSGKEHPACTALDACLWRPRWPLSSRRAVSETPSWEGALPAARAASWVWSAVYRELCHDPTWRVHLATWTLEETREVLALVAGAPPATGLQRMDQR